MALLSRCYSSRRIRVWFICLQNLCEEGAGTSIIQNTIISYMLNLWTRLARNVLPCETFSIHHGRLILSISISRWSSFPVCFPACIDGFCFKLSSLSHLVKRCFGCANATIWKDTNRLPALQVGLTSLKSSFLEWVLGGNPFENQK